VSGAGKPSPVANRLLHWWRDDWSQNDDEELEAMVREVAALEARGGTNVRGGPWRFWVEVKAPGGKLTAHQASWHERERAAGGVVLVADSVPSLVHLMQQQVGWHLDLLSYTPPVGKQRESEVQKAIKGLLHSWRFRVTDTSQGYRPGGGRHGTTRITRGTPDLYVTRPAWGQED
jgi:hypothetical protein